MEGLEPTLREGFGNPCELVAFYGSLAAYMFIDGAASEAYLNWDVPLHWAPGTDLYAAIHWSPGPSSAIGSVRWGLEFTTAPVGGVFSVPSTFYITGNTDGTQYKHIQSVSAPYPGAAVTQNQRFLIRVFRDGGAPEDTFAANAYLVGVDFYYRVSRFGTSTYSPPYT